MMVPFPSISIFLSKFSPIALLQFPKTTIPTALSNSILFPFPHFFLGSVRSSRLSPSAPSFPGPFPLLCKLQSPILSPLKAPPFSSFPLIQNGLSPPKALTFVCPESLWSEGGNGGLGQDGLDSAIVVESGRLAVGIRADWARVGRWRGGKGPHTRGWCREEPTGGEGGLKLDSSNFWPFHKQNDEKRADGLFVCILRRGQKYSFRPFYMWNWIACGNEIGWNEKRMVIWLCLGEFTRRNWTLLGQNVRNCFDGPNRPPWALTNMVKLFWIGNEFFNFFIIHSSIPT